MNDFSTKLQFAKINAKIADLIKDGLTTLTCETCNKTISTEDFKDHILSKHSDFIDEELSEFWVVSIMLDRSVPFEYHKDENNDEYKKYFKQKKVMSREEASELKKSLGIKSTNKEIQEYLENNPYTPSLNKAKFGKPQDKYRHNFYGNKTMEFDNWRTINKKR